MVRKTIMITLLGLGLLGSASAANLVDIQGEYLCKGYDPTMTPGEYSGKIKITKDGSAYLLNEDDSNYYYKQIGYREGNHLALAFQESDNAKIFGTEYMSISNNGRILKGTFLYWDQHRKVGTETCTRVSK